VAACDREHATDDMVSDAVAVLRGWNGQMEKSLAAPLVASLVYLRLRRAVADAASPGKGELYDYQIAPAIIQAILENGGRGWFSDLDGVLVRCLKEALEQGRKLQGGNVKGWRYGAYNQLTIKQPVGGQIPLFGGFFNIGPVPMSGSSTTVKQTTAKLGPSMRFIADVGNWDGSLNNITLGESGEILSGHYADQWNAYYAGKSFPMQFDKITPKHTLQVVPLGR
jgi:penicillin amidase